MGEVFEVTISDVSITNVGFAIFLKPVSSKSPRVVPIFIGPLETYSISSAIDGVTPPRPNTHDLMLRMIQELDARLLHVTINDISGSIFYARIVIQSEDGIIELDARPSDSVALALRAKCPIYMHEKVYREAAVIIGEEGNITESDPFSDEDEEIPVSEVAQLLQKNPKSEAENLKIALEAAVAAEDFEEAARLRDEINRLSSDN
jgi:uncharacterized protein